MTESEEKRLQIIREKMAQMQAREKAILAREKERQRKERNRRLFKYGEIVEKHLDCAGMEPEEFELLLKIKLGEGLHSNN